MARLDKRKTDPGSGGHNRKITEVLKKKIKRKLERNPFLTSHGLQVAIPELRQVSKRAISRVVTEELKIPSRRAAKKPFLTAAQKLRRLDWAKRHQRWS